MALVTITEASKLTKKNRTTLYRYIKDGKLSKTTDETGKDKLDTSELLRVFGNLRTTDSNKSSNNQKQQDATLFSDAQKQEMQQKIQHLEQQLLNKDELLKAKEDHIGTLKQALLLLEYKQQITPNEQYLQTEDLKDDALSARNEQNQEQDLNPIINVEAEKPKRRKIFGIF